MIHGGSGVELQAQKQEEIDEESEINEYDEQKFTTPEKPSTQDTAEKVEED